MLKKYLNLLSITMTKVDATSHIVDNYLANFKIKRCKCGNTINKKNTSFCKKCYKKLKEK